MERKTIKEKLFTAYLNTNGKAIAMEYNNQRYSRNISMLFYKLFTSQEEGINRDDLIEYVWGDLNYFICRSFDVHYSKMKKIFKPDFEFIRIGRSSETIIKLKPKTNGEQNSPSPTIG